MKLSKSFPFEASHRLPLHQGKCARLHGHSWILEVEFEGPVDPISGMVLDFYDIKQAVQPIVDDLDHRHLGSWEDITRVCDWEVAWLPMNWNPTSENLLLQIAKRLTPKLRWSALTLHETCTSAATLTREEFDA